MALFCLFFYADSLRQYGGDGVDVSHRKIDVPPREQVGFTFYGISRN